MMRIAMELMLLLSSLSSDPLIIRHDIRHDLVIVNESEFQGVFQLSLRDQLGTVTFEGTLIRDNWILTCAHFADEGLLPNQSLKIEDRLYKIDSIILHPQYEGWENDIALIKLNNPVADINPLPLYEGKVDPGQLLWSIGTGSFGTGDTGITRDDEIKRKVTNRLTQITREWLFFKFDPPDSPDVTALEGVSGPGNSGGPALIELERKYYVVGVSSHSETSGQEEGTYGVVDIYSNTSSAGTLEWIKRTIDAVDFLSIEENKAITALIPKLGPTDNSNHQFTKEYNKMKKKLLSFNLQMVGKNNDQITAVYAKPNTNFKYHLLIDLDTDFNVEDYALSKEKTPISEDETSELPKELTARTDLWNLPPTYTSLRISDFFTMCLSTSPDAVTYFLDRYYEDVPGHEDESNRFFTSVSGKIVEVRELRILETKKNRSTVQFYSGDVLWTLGVSVNKTEPYQINGLSISNDL